MEKKVKWDEYMMKREEEEVKKKGEDGKWKRIGKEG